MAANVLTHAQDARENLEYMSGDTTVLYEAGEVTLDTMLEDTLKNLTLVENGIDDLILGDRLERDDD